MLLSIGTLVRSRTLVYVFAIVSLGTFLISTGPIIPNVLVASKLICAVYLLALATYLYNDLTDYNVDKINKRKTAFSSEPSKYKATLYSTVAFFLISISLAFSINLQTGAASLVFLLLAITYSHPRTHFKDKFVLKTLVTAAGGSIASLMGYFASDSSSYLGIISSFIAFMFWFTLGPLGDVSDIRGDKQNGRRTFPIVIGIRNTFLLMHLVITAIVSLIILLYYLHEINMLGLILSTTVCAITYFMIRRVSKYYEDKKIIKQTRTTLRYSLFAIQIMVFLGLITSQVIL
ncbi:MAG: UbiA prenyltransferase family protein [Thaumarchaeota archaeon]|nr:UbiA prenyltransferase family protein [Nitrososphaerota archaeon]